MSTNGSDSAYCYACGAEMDPNSDVCLECGVEQETQGGASGQTGVSEKYCSNCGEVIDEAAEICPECGVRQASASSDVERVPAALLALLLGGVGAHKFYMGETTMGLLYLCFSWTLIPAIAGLIEGIIYLTKSEAEFKAQYGN
jgi:TM2 domain-containing membrane protein YozV/RNA polymerase subunit RPABC4/transcription elongation factor Spt4